MLLFNVARLLKVPLLSGLEEEEMDFTFAELLRSYRERASLAQAELAAALNIHRNTLSGWECGQHRPQDAEQVLRLAEELALSSTETDQLLSAVGLLPAHGTPTPRPARHQLRPPIADFVGRSAEIARLVEALQTAAKQGRGAVISSVQGMGGIGKTELAYLVTQQLLTTFPDAQIVVSLRGTSAQPLSPEQALRSVIYALTPEAKLPDDLLALQAHYQSVLHEKRVLVLADDAADAAQVRPLIAPAGCALLTTSRQRFTLPGMATVDLDQLAEAEAIALLRTIAPRLSTADAQALAQACGYLPLALRVSASMLHTTPALKLVTYLAQLRDARQRLACLRDPDDPGLDVAASLTLSYAQLDASAQSAFHQLGVLVADFATDLARAVVEVPAGTDIEPMLYGLLRRNLIMYDAARERWRLHDLVRDLARSCLEAVGEDDTTWWRYARAAVAHAAHIQEHFLAGSEQAVRALAQFDAARPHFDAARRWAWLHAGVPAGDQLILDDAVATDYIGHLRYDPRHERIPLWEEVRTAARRLSDRHIEAVALNNLGSIYMRLGDTRRAISYSEQALTLAQEIGDRLIESYALNLQGGVYLSLGATGRAVSYCEQTLILAQESGDQRWEGMARGNLGCAYAFLGEPAKALSYFEQALAIARECGHWRGEGHVLASLGITYTDLGDTRRAIRCCEEACSIARTMGDRRAEGYILSYLARAQARQGDRTDATRAFEHASALFQEVVDRRGLAECQWLFGLEIVQHGARAQALLLLHAAVIYEQEIGHAKAAEHAALLARLEAGEDVLAPLCNPAGQRAVGAAMIYPQTTCRAVATFPARATSMGQPWRQ
jgi:tetratricopeptide (TPR) repeat protein/transcriptional regulator with XRE-family HTH domain